MARQTRAIHIHDSVRAEWFDVSSVAEFLAARLPSFDIRLGGPLLEGASSPEDTAERLCAMRVTHPMRVAGGRRPLKPEVDYEKRVLVGETAPSFGVLYDGNDLQRAAYGALPPDRRGPDEINIWFTRRAIATWDDADRRYHARVVVLGQPSIVSTTGMVIAPARERAYYLARRMGVSPGKRDAAQSADYLDHEQPRLAEAAKGYAMQAALHTLAGDPFCDNPRCRLYNAHWQSELLEAQFSSPDFCDKHKDIIRSL